MLLAYLFAIGHSQGTRFLAGLWDLIQWSLESIFIFLMSLKILRMNDKTNSLYKLIFLVSIFFAPVSQGEIAGELFLFPKVAAIFHSDLDNAIALENNDYKYGIDIFATYEYRDFRVLGEYLLTEDELDLERILLGWVVSDHTFWIGRNHTPIEYWNTQFHHGTYLKTSISRPAIVEYEHDGGILPMHVGGLLLEGVFKRGEQGFGYAWSIGAGPEYEGGLEEWHALSPETGKQGISTTLNLYLEPVLYAPTRYGLFVNYTEIPAKSRGLDEIKQISSGIYGNWKSQSWRLIGSSFFIHNRLESSNGAREDEFFSAYIQAEYSISDKWILFGRLEASIGDEDDAYLALFPEFINERIMGGIRVNIIHHNALKLEFSRNRTSDDVYGQFMLQWDAMF